MGGASSRGSRVRRSLRRGLRDRRDGGITHMCSQRPCRIRGGGRPSRRREPDLAARRLAKPWRNLGGAVACVASGSGNGVDDTAVRAGGSGPGGHSRAAALPGRQGRLLFAYLVLNRDRDCGRAELIDLLWPERPPAAADTALSALLSKLRRALGDGALAGRSELRLVPPGTIDVDVEAAATAAAARRGRDRRARLGGRCRRARARCCRRPRRPSCPTATARG